MNLKVFSSMNIYNTNLLQQGGVVYMNGLSNDVKENSVGEPLLNGHVHITENPRVSMVFFCSELDIISILFVYIVFIFEFNLFYFLSVFQKETFTERQLWSIVKEKEIWTTLWGDFGRLKMR